MLIWAAKTLPAFVGRMVFLIALFAAAAALQMAGTAMLRAQGFAPSAALLLAGGAVLAFVLGVNGVVWLWGWRRARRLDALRTRHGLPAGPCCVVWRPGAGGHTDMPWEVEGVVRAEYPRLARRLRIEGFAIVDFEMTSEGRAKNLHRVDAWPGDLFYDAAAEALGRARFNLKTGEAPRLGKFYRMPFVFRVEGAAETRDEGRRAAPPRPRLTAAREAAERLRRRA